MSISRSDVTTVEEQVASVLGPPNEWTKWDGGWPGDIEAALIDSVFSARAVYNSKYGRGVLALVKAWQHGRSRTSFDLEALVSEIDKVGPPAWAESFGNQQRSPSRPPTAPGGPSKAATVLGAAKSLSAIGISSANDITDKSVSDVKRELLRIPGIGFATTNYFLMLLGRPGVKPDRMIHRFLDRACGHEFSNADAEELVTTVANRLDVPAHQLDHAIWSYESCEREGEHFQCKCVTNKSQIRPLTAG